MKATVPPTERKRDTPALVSEALAPRVIFGRSRRRLRLAGVSTVADTKLVILVTVAAVLCAMAFACQIALGDFPVTLAQLRSILAGRDDGFGTTVVLEWRLPRALAAVVFGTALGISGAVFQSTTRNPLGSPDVMGLGAGAFTGALIAIMWFGGGAATVWSALVGGLLTALLVYAITWRRGISSLRFVVVGIAVASALSAVNTLMLLRMTTRQATIVSIWGQGTLENLRWSEVAPLSVVLLLVGAGVLVLAPGMRQIELGDDTARATGVRLEPTRLAALALGAVLIALVTSVCGPIAFIALAAPQIARIVAGTAGTTLVGAAAIGAVLLSVADVIATHLLPVSVPVGVVTVVIGGLYLIWLILKQARKA